MSEQEERLTGSNTAESVIRLGSTVRKPSMVATPAVHSFLKHLRAASYDGSPDALGIDAHGRQILDFIPGTLWYGGPPYTQSDLRELAVSSKHYMKLQSPSRHTPELHGMLWPSRMDTRANAEPKLARYARVRPCSQHH